MSLHYDVLIVGGGVVGLTAALAMAQRGYQVAVLDAATFAADSNSSNSRVYALNQASQALLKKLHVWPHLSTQRYSPYTSMYVWDALSDAHIHFDSRHVAASYLGIIIEESELKKALLDEINKLENICLVSHCTIDNVQCGEQEVCVSQGSSTWHGQLLMVADGANSPTRQKLQVELTSWSYHQHALIATVSTEKKHQRCAYQIFHPEGPLAFLPLSDAHQCSIVWTTTPAQMSEVMSLNDRDFNERLSNAFARKLGSVKLLDSRQQFPLRMRHVQQYVGPRWLLLGDAAHTIHPLAGLGLNVGLADVQTWLNYLDKYPGPLMAQKRLKAYQRARKNDVWQIIALMEGFKRLFSTSFLPAVLLRRWGLNGSNQCLPLKRLFIEHAQGYPTS